MEGCDALSMSTLALWLLGQSDTAVRPILAYITYVAECETFLSYPRVSPCQTYPPSYIPVGGFLLGAAVCAVLTVLDDECIS